MKQPIKTAGEFFHLIRFSCKTAPPNSSGFASVLKRALYLWRKEEYLPWEGFRFGLYDPDLDKETLSRYISKKSLMKIQARLNPGSWSPVTEDKSLFYRYCGALGIPMPRLYAIFFKNSPGWSPRGMRLFTPEDWIQFFGQNLPETGFVIKPSKGVYGEKIMVFDKNREGIRDSSEKPVTPEQILHTMETDLKYDSFIIQERLCNHEEIIRLSKTKGLQTVRIVTHVNKQGVARIIVANLKAITGKKIIDNFDRGLTGNVLIEVFTDTGILKKAMTINEKGDGTKIIITHPKTGVAFEGFQLPLWEESCALARRAAALFLRIRTIGWDVALTPRGPVIVEGNMWWDPPNRFLCADKIREALKH